MQKRTRRPRLQSSHYHIERNGQLLRARVSKFQEAWHAIARTARLDPTATWRVVTCGCRIGGI